ncbi:MAG: glycosyltransferase 61 family protein [Saprospiraceae bacterium]|nr:glycosyltransferase 61 family protein [Saprospiraceae bacterium]
MKSIKLQFDTSVHIYGSKEHYWHFMLGYLLPSIHFYVKHGNSYVKKWGDTIQLIYDNCGPLMNPIIEEMTQLLNIPSRIVDDESKDQITIDETVNVPRWDIRMYISFYFLFHFKRFDTNIPIRKKDLKWFVKKNIKYRTKKYDLRLKRDLLFTRNLILQRLNVKIEPNETSILLLDRSDTPSFYAPNGKAEIKGYGKSRRALQNLEECRRQLTADGIQACLYEPGIHSLSHQIKTFHNSKGIVAMRGAELANMFWMPPKSKAVIIGFNNPAFHLYNFASLLHINLIEKGSHSDFPDILDYPIKSLLKS